MIGPIGAATANLAALAGAAPAPAAVFLPPVASPPLAAYGAKVIVSGYAGPIYRLVRASDNATRDVYPASGSDKPDYAAISVWIGESSAAFDIVYDQTGNGLHATQTAAASRPQYVASRSSGGVTGISFDSRAVISPVTYKHFILPAGVSFNR